MTPYFYYVKIQLFEKLKNNLWIQSHLQIQHVDKEILCEFVLGLVQ